MSTQHEDKIDLDKLENFYRDRTGGGGEEELILKLIALARKAQEPAIPEGWALVPIEPTVAMMKAGRSSAGTSMQIWSAMIAAAPQGEQK